MATCGPSTGAASPRSSARRVGDQPEGLVRALGAERGDRAGARVGGEAGEALVRIGRGRSLLVAERQGGAVAAVGVGVAPLELGEEGPEGHHLGVEGATSPARARAAPAPGGPARRRWRGARR